MATTTQRTQKMPRGSEMHEAVDKFVAATSRPFNISQSREAFHRRALDDITVNSNDSTMMMNPSNPTLFKEEVENEHESFKRLKYTYIEQEAKRNFVFMITGDEPSGVQSGENDQRQAINVEKKATLKALKQQVHDMRDEAVSLSKENAQRHDRVTSTLTEAQALQKSIRDMELELARIKANYPAGKRVTTAQAQEILDNQADEIQRLMTDTEEANKRRDQVREEVSTVSKELQRLSREREREEARAEEVQQGREAGDTKVDEMCRWLTSSITFYKSMMGIKNVQAVSEYQLQIEYDAGLDGGDAGVILLLNFDTLAKRLAGAELIGSNEDITEAANLACATNDVPGLIADVLLVIRPST